MSAFKAMKSHDPPPKLYKPSKKVTKLKAMLAGKREKGELVIVDRGQAVSKRDRDFDREEVIPSIPQTEAKLMPPGSKVDLDNFDPRQYLYDELVDFVDLLSTAKQTYRELPDGENASSLSMIVRELRGLASDLYEVTQQDKDNLYHKFDLEIIQPMMKKLIQAFVIELDSTRRQLVASIGEEKSGEISSIVKSAGKNLRPLVSQVYSDLMREVAKLLAVKQDWKTLADSLNQ